MTKSTALVVSLSALITLVSVLSAIQYRQGARYWESRANLEMARAESIAAGQARTCDSRLSSVRDVNDTCQRLLGQSRTRLQEATDLLTQQGQAVQGLINSNRELEQQVRILCPAVADDLFPSEPPRTAAH